MRHLRYYSDATWTRLPIDDFRPRFFVESYLEKLRMHTPHFYQSRLLNIFSACSEMMEHLIFLQESDKNGGYIISSFEEMIGCWEGDPIAQEMFSEFAILKVALVRKVKAGELDLNVQSRLKVLCRKILSRREQYLSVLVEQIEDAILGVTDLTQKDRITSSIDRLAGLYTTFLLNQGYSPTYLFNRVAMFVRENNYSGRTFSEQFRMVTSRLKNQQIHFDVYYGFHTTKPNVLLSVSDESDLQFISTIPPEISGSELEKFKKNIDINVVAKLSLTSTDYVTAALRTKERIDRFLDAATALEFGNEFQVSANCVTIYRGQPTHIKSLNMEVLLAFMSSESGSAISHQPLAIRGLFKHLDDAAKEQLGRSLRHLRLAKNSVSVEQKLLNLWIALESIFSGTGATIIGGILEFVPQFCAVMGLIRRVAYLRELLVANEIVVTPIISAHILPGTTVFDASVTDEQMFLILKHDTAALELFNSLGNMEHLKFKLTRIRNELKNNKAISDRLERSGVDVNRQLRRIYFLRNKIAHTGHFHGVRPQLVTHLLDYVSISYRVIATAASRSQLGNTYAISELLEAARMGADLVAARVASKDEVLLLDHVTLQPVI